MAILRKGFLGGFSGPLGPGSGSSWRGIDIIKSRPGPRKKKGKMLKQQIAMDILSRFLSPFKVFIRFGFYNKKNKDSAYNRAMHHNWEKAIIGSAPNYKIDYSRIILSRGSREPAWAATMTVESEECILIRWEVPETAKMNVIGNDFAIILMYNESVPEYISYSDTAIRSDLSALFFIPYAFRGAKSHIWIFFVTPDGKSVSNSDYLGSVTIAAVENEIN